MAEPKLWRFNHVANKIKILLRDEGILSEVDIEVDQYNNTIKIYYESTEEWDFETLRWRAFRDEDEERWLN